MKRMFAMLMLVLAGALGAAETRTPGFSAPIPAPKQPISKEKNKVNLNLNKEFAIKLAEIILADRYGENVLKQRPWKISENNDSYKIVGTFHGGPGAKGGVEEIIISKSDARVLAITHGK